jgi:hypothetical protein
MASQEQVSRLRQEKFEVDVCLAHYHEELVAAFASAASPGSRRSLDSSLSRAAERESLSSPSRNSIPRSPKPKADYLGAEETEGLVGSDLNGDRNSRSATTTTDVTPPRYCLYYHVVCMCLISVAA